MDKVGECWKKVGEGEKTVRRRLEKVGESRRQLEHVRIMLEKVREG